MREPAFQPSGVPWTPMRTRLAEVEDAQALLTIWNPEIVELVVSLDLVPKSLEEQRSWILEHRTSYVCLVAINEEDEVGEMGARGDQILGFASLSAFRDKPAYATTVENSVYVHRDARGRGVGERLLRDLLAAAEKSGYHSIIARIVGENASSIRLHEKCGFTLVGTEIEVGRKHGRWHDVVEYQYVVSSTPPRP